MFIQLISMIRNNIYLVHQDTYEKNNLTRILCSSASVTWWIKHITLLIIFSQIGNIVSSRTSLLASTVLRKQRMWRDQTHHASNSFGLPPSNSLAIHPLANNRERKLKKKSAVHITGTIKTSKHQKQKKERRHLQRCTKASKADPTCLKGHLNPKPHHFLTRNVVLEEYQANQNKASRRVQENSWQFQQRKRSHKKT